MPSFAIYFTAYEAIRRNLAPVESDTEQQARLKSVAFLMSGGFASVICQCCTYPTDFLKTRLQTTRGETRGIFQLASEIYREQGLRRMYSGLHVTILKGFPACCVSMLVFERAKLFFGSL